MRAAEAERQVKSEMREAAAVRRATGGGGGGGAEGGSVAARDGRKEGCGGRQSGGRLRFSVSPDGDGVGAADRVRAGAATLAEGQRRGWGGGGSAMGSSRKGLPSVVGFV